MSARFRIGIDLGGTKIEGAAIDACGSVRFRHRVATPAQDYRETINAIIDLVSTIEQEIGATPPVGIGIPGAVSPATGLIKNATSTWLIGRPLQRDLERALGRPTRLANDANCFACPRRPTAPAPRRRRSSASFSGRASEAGSPSDARSWPAPTQS